MTRHRYPLLLAAALAAAFIGTATAQSQSSDNQRLPAKRGVPQEQQTQPSEQQTPKMKDQQQGKTAMNQNEAQKPQMGNTAMSSDQQAKSAGEAPSGTSTSSAQWGKQQHQAKRSSKNGQPQAMRSQSGHQQQAMNSHKGARHAAKSKRPSEEAATPEEKAYRQALRGCVEQQQRSQRESCIDNAIERFHRSA
jgi:hypothetical protein